MADDKKEKREFGTPQQVWDVSEEMQQIEDYRAKDRARIDSLMNGQKPYSKAEEEKYNIQINVNWGEGKRIMMDANRQLNNAFLHPGTLFNCSLEEGPADKRREWGLSFTNLIHKPIQRNRTGERHHYIMRSRNATICMHGVGVVYWANNFDWLPRYVPMEDFLVPTDTYCDFTNSRYFAINLYLAPGELVEMALSPNADRHWNREQVQKILDAHKYMYTESTPSTWRDQPQAMRQVHDQNKGYYYSDAVPKIRLRVFYWRDIKKPYTWYRTIILRENYGDAKLETFVYDGSENSFANRVNHIVNITYGDNNIVAPLKYHSVRGLGQDLWSQVEISNRLRCEFLQAVFEHVKMYFKINDPADRDRLKQVVLQQYGFIPEGLTIVPRDQRHQIDASLVDDALSQTRQLMNENSAAFVQNVNDGTQKEMTKFEAQARLNQVNVMIGGMLQMMYVQEGFYYEELVRRFCMDNPTDPDIKEFQRDCEREGIPGEYMKAHMWRVTPERVLGGGDKTLAQAESQWLIEHKNLFDPQSQQKIMRIATSTMLDDPAKGLMLVPSVSPTSTDGTRVAQMLFGTLMQGVPVDMVTGIDQIGYIEAILKMMGAVVQRITSTDNVGTAEELIGLVTASQNVSQHIMVLAGDPKERQRVRQYGDSLGQLMNLIKAFAQRQAQARQAQQPQQQDPKAAAQAQATMMNAQVKAQISAQKAMQKQKERQVEFQLDMARENMRTLSEIRREQLTHHQKMTNDALESTVSALRGLRQTAFPEGSETN